MDNIRLLSKDGYEEFSKIITVSGKTVEDFSLPPGNGGTVINPSTSPSSSSVIPSIAPSSFPNSSNKVLEFNGKDSYIKADSVCKNITRKAFSVGAWVYNYESEPEKYIMAFNSSSGGNYNLFGIVDCSFLYWDGSSITSKTKFQLNKWYHVMFVIDESDNGIIYVNGKADKTFKTTLRPEPDGRFSIGQEWDSNSTSQHFKGVIDDVSVWNKALLPQEVQNVMNGNITGNETDLAPFWKFNEGSDTTINDSSTNKNTGTIFNTKWLDSKSF